MTPIDPPARYGAIRNADSSRMGKAVEHLVAATCIIRSRARLNVSTSLVDDEGVDAVFHRRGGSATLAVQVKARMSDSKTLSRGTFRANVRGQVRRPATGRRKAGAMAAIVVEQHSVLVARHAPLVRVWADDPPADPDVWLADCDLVRYDETEAASTVCAAPEYPSWPADARGDGVRPYESSSAGLAFVPSARAPNLVAADARAPSFGRFPLRDGEVVAPCLYEVEAAVGGTVITYWFFFPTSTTPANLFTQMVPAVIDSMREGQLSPDQFPPLSVTVVRRDRDRFWDAVAGGSGFGAEYVEAGRRGGVLGTAVAAFAYQALGIEAPELITQLDPVAQERILSLYVHEGDWEGVSVELNRTGELANVVYWAHGKAIVDPEPVPHPVDGIDRIVVDVAGGSHACGRPSDQGAGAPPLDPARRLLAEGFSGSTGASWRTWDQLRPVRSAEWYGFGGAWGRPRLPPVGSLVRRRLQSMDLWVESTGPLGPGPLKLDRNRKALRSISMTGIEAL